MAGKARARETIELSSGDEAVAPQPRRRRTSGSASANSSNAPVVDLTDDTEEPAFASATELQEWARPAAAITCPICFCDSEPVEAASLSACGHAFCVDCISTYTRGKVEAGEVLPGRIVCPCVEPTKCGRALTLLDIHRCLEGNEERQRYDRLALQRCIEDGDDLGARIESYPAAGASASAA